MTVKAATTGAATDALRNYGACVFASDDLVEVRCLALKPNRVTEQYWMPARELAQNAGDLARLNGKGFNVYAGVNPRRRRGSHGVSAKDCTDDRPCGACAKCVAIHRTLFADFDGVGEGEARQRIEDACLPAPTLLVNSGHGVHAYWRLAVPMTDAAQWRGRMEALTAQVKSDSKCVDPPRILRLPGFLNTKAEPVLCEIIDADPAREYDLREFPEPRPRVHRPATTASATLLNGHARDASLARDALALLGRNRADDYDSWLCVGMILHAVDSSDAMLAQWDGWSRTSGKYQPDECAWKWGTFNGEGGRKLGTLIHWAREDSGDASFGKGPANVKRVAHLSQTSPASAPAAPDPAIAKLRSDIGNAARFVRDHGANVRWCVVWGKWLVWNGKRWEVDERERVLDLAIKSALAIFDEAKDAQSDGEREELAKHAARSQHRDKLTAMIALAKPALAIVPSDLDADIWLLNCKNGTVDLRTGELHEHRREDYITKMAGTAYNPEATCELFQSVLHRALAGDKSLISYVQRFHGYCLTGDISEQIMLVDCGEGANGKNTLLDAIGTVMGDYADTAPPDLLMQRKHDEHPTEIAGLDGKRLIVASESEKNRRLKIQLVKRLTGDATLKGRFMRGDYFSFARRFKVVLVTNNRPRVDEATEAIWRRLKLVPFEVVIPPAERDGRLGEKLMCEAEGIMAWLVQGALDWQENGLGEPKRVEQATLQYRRDSDPMRLFLDECCELDAGAWTLSKELRARYVSWCEERGDRPIGGKDFTDALTAAGCSAQRKYLGRGWAGISLLHDGMTAHDGTSCLSPYETEKSVYTDGASCGVMKGEQ